MFTEKFPDNRVPTQYTTHNLNKSYEMDASMHDLLGSVHLKFINCGQFNEMPKLCFKPLKDLSR